MYQTPVERSSLSVEVEPLEDGPPEACHVVKDLFNFNSICMKYLNAERLGKTLVGHLVSLPQCQLAYFNILKLVYSARKANCLKKII